MTTDDTALQAIREEIDDLDYQIHTLLNQRAALALHVADIKIAQTPAGEEPEFFRPTREQAILAAIRAFNQGPLSAEAIMTIFQGIIRQCCQLQVDYYQAQVDQND